MYNINKVHVARNEQDARTGLKDNRRNAMFFPNSNRMTMQGMQTPVKYYGVTQGKITDEGVAYPGQDFRVNGDSTLEFRIPMRDGGIHINPANRGKFTASANRVGMGVQEYAHKVVNNPNSSETLRKRAQFAINASRWKHCGGGMYMKPTLPVKR